MSRRARVSYGFVLLSLSCSAANVPPPEPSAQQASTGVMPAAPSATAVAAPTAVASATPEEPPPDAPDPLPLTKDEQKEAERACKPLMDAVQRSKGSGKSPMQALEGALVKPPAAMKPAQVERCRDLMTRGIQTYMIAAKEVEATMVLNRVARAMAIVYGDKGKLCPSSDRPVPADRALVASGPHQSTEEEWSAPSWKCLGFSYAGLPQRFQYEVRADADGKGFSVIARGTPGTNGNWVELSVNGKVGPKSVEVGGVVRRPVK